MSGLSNLQISDLSNSLTTLLHTKMHDEKYEKIIKRKEKYMTVIIKKDEELQSHVPNE